jgi:hypothetical protein
MKTVILVGILIAIIVGFILALKFTQREKMGGYAITSGLYYNNNAKHCFTNPYDPPGFGYCTTIGKVVI